MQCHIAHRQFTDYSALALVSTRAGTSTYAYATVARFKKGRGEGQTYYLLRAGRLQAEFASAIRVFWNRPRSGADLDNMVVSVNECDGRLPALHHGFWNLAVGHNDDQIAEVHEVRSGTVELDDTGASRTGDRVGGQAIAIVHVRNVDSLPGRNVRRVQQVLIDGDRTDVV